MDEMKEIKADIKELDDRLTDVEKVQAVMIEHNNNRDELIARNVEVLDGLRETMQNTNTVMTTLSADVNRQSAKIDSLETKINTVQEERNINIVKWLRDNWYTIVLAGGLIYEVAKDLI